MATMSYLVKVGDYEVPLKFMSLESYNATLSTTDLDSTRMADNTLQRNVLKKRVLKVEFDVPVGYLSNLETFLSALKSAYSNQLEKKATVKAYVPEQCAYVTQACYVPDISVKIIENSPNGFIVDKTRIAFIGYGGTV